MNSDVQRTIDTPRGALPHPMVLVVALMLALAGVWCVTSGQSDDESDLAVSLLREQVGRAKNQYLRVSRQATATRMRLLAAQDQLQRYTSEQYDELHRAATSLVLETAVEPETAEPLELTEANADRIEAEHLKQRLTELGQERNHLLERLTAEHPLVNDVDLQTSDVLRLIDTLKPAPESIPPPPAVLVQTDSQTQQRLRRAWAGLVDAAVAGGQLLDLECRRIQQEVVDVEAQRSAAEKSYLASSDALASGARTVRLDSSRSKEWGMIFFGCAIGLPLLTLASRIAATSSVTDDPLIREASEVERLFRLPVAGWIGIAGAVAAVVPMCGRAPVRWSLLMMQIFAAVIVFLVVAMTIQNPHWLAQVPSHPIDAFCSAAGNLGGG